MPNRQALPVPTVHLGEYYAGTSAVIEDDKLHISTCLTFGHHRALYILHGAPEILEFAKMLKVSLTHDDPIERNWQGNHFFAYFTAGQTDGPYNFRRHSDEGTFAFSNDEWSRLDQLMDKLLATPEMRQALSHHPPTHQ